jgi:hypothetical protein
MSQQEIRRKARRDAREREVKVRREREQTDRRCSDLGVSVVVALGQRDEVIAQYEYKAADALSRLLHLEGLSLQEACGWAGGVPQPEARRLLRMYPPVDQGQKGTEQ